MKYATCVVHISEKWPPVSRVGNTENCIVNTKINNLSPGFNTPRKLIKKETFGFVNLTYWLGESMSNSSTLVLNIYYQQTSGLKALGCSCGKISFVPWRPLQDL